MEGSTRLIEKLSRSEISVQRDQGIRNMVKDLADAAIECNRNLKWSKNKEQGTKYAADAEDRIRKITSLLEKTFEHWIH